VSLRKPLKVIVLAASSDIGGHLVEHFLYKGAVVVGTYRNRTHQVTKLENMGAKLFPLDLTSGDQIISFVEKLQSMEFSWNTFISAVGLLEPINSFFSTNFDYWEDSVIINSTGQMRILHAVHGLREQSGLSKVLFFAGGGTNSAFDNYSAYCIGKLALIKMTELLHSENLDLQVSIIGTGWVNTKIHQQTLDAGESAGSNLNKTLQFIANSKNDVVSLETVTECIDWCLSAPRNAVGGRNFSLVHDRWREPKFVEELIANPNSYKLRRFS